MGLTRCEGDTLGCAQVRFAGARICDGFDHDCDGTIDADDALCPADQVCVGASCLARCGPANVCPVGRVCTDGGCTEASCADVTLVAGLVRRRAYRTP